MTLKDKLADFINSPEYKEIQKELNEYITEVYNDFDNTDFVGMDPGQFVKVYYNFKRKGFFKTEIDNAVFEDKTFLEECIPAAINNALVQYGDADKAIRDKVYAKETELYNRLIEVARAKAAPAAESDLFVQPTKKKTYLN